MTRVGENIYKVIQHTDTGTLFGITYITILQSHAHDNTILLTMKNTFNSFLFYQYIFFLFLFSICGPKSNKSWNNNENNKRRDIVKRNIMTNFYYCVLIFKRFLQQNITK